MVACAQTTPATEDTPLYRRDREKRVRSTRWLEDIAAPKSCQTLQDDQQPRNQQPRHKSADRGPMVRLSIPYYRRHCRLSPAQVTSSLMQEFLQVRFSRTRKQRGRKGGREIARHNGRERDQNTCLHSCKHCLDARIYATGMARRARAGDGTGTTADLPRRVQPQRLQHRRPIERHDAGTGGWASSSALMRLLQRCS